MAERGWRTLAKVAFGWDVIIAVVAAIIYLLFVLDGEYIPDRSIALFWAAGLMVTIALALSALPRWVSDRLKDGPYGEILRAVDPEEQVVGFVYYWTAGVATVSAILCAVFGFLVPEVGRGPRVAMYGVAVFFVSWSVVGAAQCFLITYRMQRKISGMQSERERFEREIRDLSSTREKRDD